MWGRACIITLAGFVFGLAGARRVLHGVVVGDGHKGPGRGEGRGGELLEDVDVGELRVRERKAGQRRSVGHGRHPEGTKVTRLK